MRCTRVFGRRRESEEFGVTHAEIFGRTVAAKVRHFSALIDSNLLAEWCLPVEQTGIILGKDATCHYAMPARTSFGKI